MEYLIEFFFRDEKKKKKPLSINQFFLFKDKCMNRNNNDATSILLVFKDVAHILEWSQK